MRSILSILFYCLLTFSVFGQNSQTDTVSVGPTYANQTWYSLQNGTQASSPKNNWHLAFEISGFASSIRINGAIGLELYLDPEGGTDHWAQLDTADLALWDRMYDSETDWASGAFNQAADPDDEFDLGWGIYSFITHTVSGNRLYVLKTADENYYKIWIEKLAGGTYTFKTAKIDGSDERTHQLIKSEFQGKSFAYFNIETNELLDREPATVDWDMLFTQYVSYIPDPYVVTGVLTNSGVQVARLYPMDFNAAIDPETADLDSASNIIGYDWKNFDLATFSWALQDSLVFVLKDKDSDFWKITFTGFGGQGTGNFIFEKELISSPNAISTLALNSIDMAAFPNPASEQFTLALDMPENPAAIHIRLINTRGQQVAVYQLNGNNHGLQTYQIPAQNLIPGLYFIQVEAGKYQGFTKVIIK